MTTPLLRRSLSRTLSLAALLTAGLAGPVGSLRATTYTWTGTAGNAWSNNGSWQGNVAPPLSGLTTSDLLFGNSSVVNLNLNGAYSIRTLTFSTGASAYTFSTGPLTLGTGGIVQNATNAQSFSTAQVILGADQTWTLASGSGALSFGGGVNTTDGGGTAHALTINAATTTNGGNVVNGVISGGGSLTKTGAGTLTLTGASTYTGVTTVSAGTLAVGSGGSLGATNITVGTGAALQLSGTGALTGTGGNLTLDGTSAAPATASLSSSGTSYRGSVIVGSNGVGSMTQSAGTLNVSTSGQFVLGSNYGSSGSYTLSGTGILSTGQANIGGGGVGTFTQTGGSFTTNGNYLGVGNDESSSTYLLSGGTLTASYIGVNSYSTFTQSGGTLTDTGLNLIGPSTFTQSGGTHTTDTLFLGSGAAYNLNGGILAANSFRNQGFTGTFNFNGGMLQARQDNTTFFQGLRRANVQAGGAQIDTSGFNVTVGQPLVHDTTSGAAGTDGGLTKLGAGTLTLTGASTYNGTTNINAGTLAYTGAGGSSGAGGFTLSGGNLLLNTSGTVAAGGILFTNSNSSVTLQAGTLQIAAGGTVSGTGGLVFQGGTLQASSAFTILGGLPISIQAGGGTVDTSGGNITSGSSLGYSGGAAGSSGGTSTLTIQGGHVLQADLTNNSAWTGPVVVTGSGTTLRNNRGNYTAAGTLTVGTGAFYDLNNSGASFGGLAGTGTVLNTGGFGFVSTLNITGASGIFSGSIAPAGGATEAASTALTLNLNSGGVLTLTGSNTYTGATTISAGNTLQLGNGGTSGSLAAGSAILDNGALVFNRSDALTAANPISGSGSLTQTGTGTLTLSGANTYTGATTVNAGTLQAGATTNAFGNNSALALANVAGASLNLNGFNETVGSLAGGGTTGGNIALGGGTLTVGTNNASTTFGGAISGSGGLTKVGTGTLTLTQASTYTGDNNVLGGNLVLASGTASSGGTNVASGSALVFAGATVTPGFNSLTAQAGGTIQFTNGTRLNGGILDGLGSYNVGTGGATFTATTINNGVNVTVAGGPATFKNVANSGAVTVASGQTLAWNGGQNNLGTLVVNGTANTGGWSSTGVITINGGGLLANGGSNLIFGGGSRTTVNAGGTLSAASGTTVELNGALLTNNGTQTGTLNVNYGSTAKGAGTFGTVNVTSGGTFSPGNSPGTAMVDALSLQAAGRYQFELSSAIAANNSPGSSSDLISVSGLLTLSAGTTANSRFTVAIVSLDASNNAAALGDFDPSKSYRFVLAAASGITGYSADEFAVDTTGFANNLGGGSFSVVQDGNNLDLVFNPAVAPEPGTWVLLTAGMGLLGVVTLRRRSRLV